MKGGRLMMLACVVALVAALGCGGSQRETTIRGALVSIDSARDGFLAYDRAHEMSLVAHCNPVVDSKEQCQSKVDASNKALADYQAKRAKIDPLIAFAYRSVAAAWLLNDQPSLDGMKAAVAQMFAAVKPFLTSTAPAGGK